MQWVRSGVPRSILEVLAQALLDEGCLDLQEGFIDGSFAPAKHGGASIGKTKRGKRSKIMAIADRQGLPVAVYVESSTPYEVRLVHATLAERFVRQLPERLIGDTAYESDRLDAELAHRGVELIAPHRRTRTQRTQDAHRLFGLFALLFQPLGRSSARNALAEYFFLNIEIAQRPVTALGGHRAN